MEYREQLYVFVDKTGRCFEDFQAKGFDELTRRYNDRVGAMLKGGEKFTVRDMFAYRDDLLNAGFEVGKDFDTKKAGG